MSVLSSRSYVKRVRMMRSSWPDSSRWRWILSLSTNVPLSLERSDTTMLPSSCWVIFA